MNLAMTDFFVIMSTLCGVKMFWKNVYFGCSSHHAINRHCFVGKRPVKISTDKVNPTSVAKNLFWGKIARQAVIHRFRNNLNFLILLSS